MRTVLVLGAGSAGLLAALSLKRKLPALTVRVVRSQEIGVIGVGEGTTPHFLLHLFQYLGISQRWFYEKARPTWKLGIHFFWGPRPSFDYSFVHSLNSSGGDLPRPAGYYSQDDLSSTNLGAALMEHGKAFARMESGAPEINDAHAFHIENRLLCETLEAVAREAGVEFIEGRVTGAERGPSGVGALHLEDGQKLEADLYVDASGFRSELLGRALEEPFVSYDRALFCDRAVIGGWEREDEPILPYTTAETMQAGWAWQIEHEHHINRGYVFSSQFISDDAAAAEFLQQNPKAPKEPRVVKFRSGRYRRSWVENVVAIGNASAFVEPLEATALMMVCAECQTLTGYLAHFAAESTPSLRGLFNARMNWLWDDIRDFLAIHYRFNTRLQTPFWRHCVEETDVSTLAPLLEFYAENGPSGCARDLLPARESTFGIEGYLALLLGNRVPFRPYQPSASEQALWQQRCAGLAERAKSGVDVHEALGWIRHPQWKWADELRATAP